MKESDYSAYIKSFTRLFEAYDTVLPYLERDDDFQIFAERKRHWLERLRSPEFPVAFLGAFSAGKSTIINAVLGEDILPQATKSFTAIPTLISRGNARKAIIHFLGEREREELKYLYIEEITKELRKPIGDYSKLIHSDLLKKLEKDIAQHSSQLGTFGKQKFFDELKKLIHGWKKHNGDVREIALSELPNYVTEDYDDVLFVDRVEINLTDIKIPENVVLVDLPGLGVVNPRHRKVTKRYVENDAKAFVIAMKVFHLLEGEEIELLAEIQGQRKRVLQRAFWCINQWDILTAKQKREEMANFDKKIESYAFNIAKERVFRVSALNFLLLRLIADGTLAPGIKIGEHVDTLQKSLGKIPERSEAESAIKQMEEAKAFSQFRASLFDYLSNTAKEEFLNEARSEYSEMTARLREKLEPLYQLYRSKSDEGLRSAYLAVELSRRQDEVLKRLREVVTEHTKMLRTDVLPELVFWQEEDQAQLAAGIEHAFDNLDRRALRNELLRGLDSHSVVSRLPHKIEENLHIQHIFRTQLQTLLDQQVIRQYLNQLSEKITAVEPLPEEIMESLRDFLSGRDLVSRMKGMCDVFLFGYGDVMDKLGRAIMNNLGGDSEVTGKSAVEWVSANPSRALNWAKVLQYVPEEGQPEEILRLSQEAMRALHLLGEELPKQILDEHRSSDAIELALQIYKAGLLDYTRQQQNEINKFARRGIKNYFEELETQLLSFFDGHKSAIAKVIMKQLTVRLEADLSDELEKQKIIKEAYHLVSVRTT